MEKRFNRGKRVEKTWKQGQMQISNGQEAIYIACEMEKGAVQLYERALLVLDSLGRSREPFYDRVTAMLAEEKGHLKQFQALYRGLDASLEHRLTLSAVADRLLFEGGLTAAARQGLLTDEAALLRFAIDAERGAAAAYRAFAARAHDAEASAALLAIASEEDRHLETLLRRQEQV